MGTWRELFRDDLIKRQGLQTQALARVVDFLVRFVPEDHIAETTAALTDVVHHSELLGLERFLLHREEARLKVEVSLAQNGLEDEEKPKR